MTRVISLREIRISSSVLVLCIASMIFPVRLFDLIDQEADIFAGIDLQYRHVETGFLVRAPRRRVDDDPTVIFRIIKRV